MSEAEEKYANHSQYGYGLFLRRGLTRTLWILQKLAFLFLAIPAFSQSQQSSYSPPIFVSSSTPVSAAKINYLDTSVKQWFVGRSTITGNPYFFKGITCTNTSGNCICFTDGTCMNTSGGAGAPFWASSGANIHNTNSGNVGINVTNAAVQLEVNGQAQIDSGIQATSATFSNQAGPAVNNIMTLRTSSTTWQMSFQNPVNSTGQPTLQIEDLNHPGLPLQLIDVPGGQRLTLWQNNIQQSTLSVSGILPTFAVGGDVKLGDIASIGNSPMSLFYRDQRSIPITSCTNFYSSYDTHFNAAVDAGATMQICPQDNAAASGSNDGYISLNANGKDTGSVANSIRFQNNNGSGVAQQVSIIGTVGYQQNVGGITALAAQSSQQATSAFMDESGGAGRFASVGTAGAYGTLQLLSTNGVGGNRVLVTGDGVNQRVGVLTGGPLSTMDVNGNVAIGTYAGTKSAPSNGMIVSGNVGISTGAPQTTLDLFGTLRASAATNGYIEMPATDSNFSASGVIMQATAVTPYITGKLGTTGSNSSFSIYSGANTNLFSVNGNGNVGINKFNPSHTFENVGTFLSSSTNNGAIQIPADNPSYSQTGVYLQALSAGHAFIASKLGTADINSAFNVHDSNDKNLFSVRGNGNIGIGVTDPGVTLDVVGNAQFGNGVNKSTFSTSGALTIAPGASITQTGANGFYTGSSSVTAIGFFGTDMRLTAGADTNIFAGRATDFSHYNIVSVNNNKTLAAGAGIYGGANQPDEQLYVVSPSSITFVTNNTNQGIVNTSGQFGVGTVSPASNTGLDVQNGGIGNFSRTIAQLLAIVPGEVGMTYFCNNCSPTKIVVSTGTSAGNFADAVGGPFK